LYRVWRREFSPVRDSGLRLDHILLSPDMSERLVGDEPDTVVDLFDSNYLTSQARAEIDLLAIQAEAATVGDDHRFVVERVVRLADALIRAAGRSIDLSRALHVERLVRTFVVEPFSQHSHPEIVQRRS
jgi:hypothetical protein